MSDTSSTVQSPPTLEQTIAYIEASAKDSPKVQKLREEWLEPYFVDISVATYSLDIDSKTHQVTNLEIDASDEGPVYSPNVTPDTDRDQFADDIQTVCRSLMENKIPFVVKFFGLSYLPEYATIHDTWLEHSVMCLSQEDAKLDEIKTHTLQIVDKAHGYEATWNEAMKAYYTKNDLKCE
jgi:hypothetical protein